MLLLILLIPLHLFKSRLFFRFVTADQATGGGAEKSVMYGLVGAIRNPANTRAHRQRIGTPRPPPWSRSPSRAFSMLSTSLVGDSTATRSDRRSFRACLLGDHSGRKQL